LGLQEFFRRFFPIGDLDGLREEAFALYYFSGGDGGGITYGDVEGMEASERQWHMKRIAQQKRAEADAMHRAQAKAKAKAASVRRRRK
jgi:hypothetical protein